MQATPDPGAHGVDRALAYRPEIDGLRALAVLGVMLFHAQLGVVEGGFLGVDVFFVISGFLITHLILEDLEQDRFSFRGFYVRRARRLLPALVLVLVVTLPFAWSWLLPGQLVEFGLGLVAVALFVSNLFFLHQSDYFGGEAERLPLVHTWSLAVEEQFYLLFPILLIALWRTRARGLQAALASATVVSLVASEVAAHSYPVANFYLPVTRAWELGVGALAALRVRGGGIVPDDRRALPGVIAVLGALFLFDEGMRLPGVVALVPVLGTALVLTYGGSGTLAARALGLRPLVGVGLVSYSAYLWHQPVFAFARLRFPADLDARHLLGLSVVVLLLAALTWYFVEQPFRRRRPVADGRFLAGLVASILALALTGGALAALDGVPERFEVDVALIERARDRAVDEHPCAIALRDADETTPARAAQCLARSDGEHFVLLGDSHAESLGPALRRRIDAAGGHLTSFTHNACLPIPDTAHSRTPASCRRGKALAWRMAREAGATVILAARWRLYFAGSRFDNGEGGVEPGRVFESFVVGDPSADVVVHALSELERAAGDTRVIVLSQIPEAGWDVPNRMLRLLVAGRTTSDLGTSYEVYGSRNTVVDAWLGAAESRGHADVLRVETLVCDDASGRCANTRDGVSLYRDDDHPSFLYAELIAEAFAEAFLRAPGAGADAARPQQTGGAARSQ